MVHHTARKNNYQDLLQLNDKGYSVEIEYINNREASLTRQSLGVLQLRKFETDLRKSL